MCDAFKNDLQHFANVFDSVCEPVLTSVVNNGEKDKGYESTGALFEGNQVQGRRLPCGVCRHSECRAPSSVLYRKSA